MKKVKTEEAVGMIISHDMTKIIPGQFQGVAFKKGHIVRDSDIPELLAMGKEYLYVWEDKTGLVHEDVAAKRLALTINQGKFIENGPKEGKVELFAKESGLLRINTSIITQLNVLGEIAVSTLPDYSHVEEGDKVAGMRVIPLAVTEEKIASAERIAAAVDWVMDVKPFRIKKAGMIITGNEVFYGRIQDRFGPRVKDKLTAVGVKLEKQAYFPDSPEDITREILVQVESGMELVLVTGGMSVDPDDATPGAIKATGASVVTYGTPIFPGAMFMLAYLGETPVLGLPGCVMHAPATVFDKFLPRVLARETITKEQIAACGVGGLCRGCRECHFPNCSFGCA